MRVKHSFQHIWLTLYNGLNVEKEDIASIVCYLASLHIQCQTLLEYSLIAHLPTLGITLKD